MSTKIEWTDETWNPFVGCSRVGPGCDHCYAIGVVHRGMSPQHVGLTVKPAGERVDWTGEVREVPHVLDKPLRWKRPRRIFVNSLSDLFHADLSDDYIARVFAVMALAPQHTFQVLTKRPQRMAKLLDSSDFWGDGYGGGVAGAIEEMRPERDEPEALARFQLLERAWATGLPNVWLGTSIENDTYTWRADHLRATPAAVRWISAEPLLGPLPSLDLTGIDWVVAGGESGHGARPMHPDWVRDLRDLCVENGHESCGPQGWVSQRVPFLFKQWGAWVPTIQGLGHLSDPNEIYVGGPVDEHGCRTIMGRVGKKAAGRELDGRTWDEYPTTEGAR